MGKSAARKTDKHLQSVPWSLLWFCIAYRNRPIKTNSTPKISHFNAVNVFHSTLLQESELEKWSDKKKLANFSVHTSDFIAQFLLARVAEDDGFTTSSSFHSSYICRHNAFPLTNRRCHYSIITALLSGCLSGLFCHKLLQVRPGPPQVFQRQSFVM